ncbi:hypothetical protein [Streptomyces gobiensis]|nr:hypothetical protein [Streptomyces gobiensis]UGY92169.1 hypothetical protein test1122_10805 [Streptomyces gobiensis]
MVREIHAGTGPGYTVWACRACAPHYPPVPDVLDLLDAAERRRKEGR